MSVEQIQDRARVGVDFSSYILESKRTPFLTFTPNVTQYVLCYIRTLTPHITAFLEKTLGFVKKMLQ